MNNDTLKYVTHQLEIVYFEEVPDDAVNCIISGNSGSGTGTYSWGPDRSDS